MTESYLKNYRILGIQPGANWKQLRQAYKKMVNAWHPDRFQQDVRQKKLAEEKTKEITQSYQELAEYYRKFGVLPLPVEEKASPAINETAAPAQSPATPGVEIPEPASTARSASVSGPRMSKRRARVIASLALLGSVYFISQIAPWEREDNAPLNEEYVDQAPQGTGRDHEGADAATAERHFTIGSSLGEVYAIQGVPTRTEQDVWYYGDSKVYFARGKVLRWDENRGSPLRVSIIPRVDENTTTRFFGRGSTKEEVLTAQGAPDRDAGSVWDYGLSRVYFEKDRVTGWYESQLNPLRARR